MSHRLLALCLLITACLAAPGALAQTPVPLRNPGGLDTFYVNVGVAGAGREEYLLDTGAGYMTITDVTLASLRRAGTATPVGEVEGHLADGSILRVPVYRLEAITIGQGCRLENVEAAVLPGASRGLLGLSAIRKASPVQLSFDPPELLLSNCLGGPTALR